MSTMNVVVDVSAMQIEVLTITVLAREGGSMAPKSVTKSAAPRKAKAAAKMPAPPKKAAAKKTAAKKTAAAPKAGKMAPSRSRLPAATIRALKELEAGNLNRYADADDLFQKLGIKLGKD
jgi:hypothetical protein